MPNVLLFLLLSVVSFSQVPSEIGPLQAAFKGKTVLIRHFYSDKEIHYNSQGTAPDAHEGAWLKDGYIEIKEVKIENGEVKMVGERLRGWISAPRKIRYEKVQENVTLGWLANGSQDMEPMAQKIFVSQNEDIAPMLPPMWQKFMTGKSAFADDKVLAAKDARKPPHPIKMKEPDEPLALAKAKYKGLVILQGVVDTDGTLRDAEITKPLGAGFDEKAVQAFESWRFEPALDKHNQPVAVRISLEVEFHIY